MRGDRALQGDRRAGHRRAPLSGDRLAQLTCSFGAYDHSALTVIGTKGRIRLDPAYEYASGLTLEMEVADHRPRRKTFPKRDQIAAELTGFARCIRERREPEPSGQEGLADLRVLEAIQRLTESGRMQSVEPVARKARPSKAQAIRRKPHGMPDPCTPNRPDVERRDSGNRRRDSAFARWPALRDSLHPASRVLLPPRRGARLVQHPPDSSWVRSRARQPGVLPPQRPAARRHPTRAIQVCGRAVTGAISLASRDVMPPREARTRAPRIDARRGAEVVLLD